MYDKIESTVISTESTSMESVSTVITTKISTELTSTIISTTISASSMISIAVRKPLIQKFTILAAESDIPRKDLIEEALENYLKLKGKL